MLATVERVKMETPIDQTYLTVREAAARLRVHPLTIKRMIHRGELEAIQVGKRRDFRILRESIERYEQQNKI